MAGPVTMARVHVIGAGLAGLGAAVALTAAGVPVALYEAAGQAGGRCRAFHDRRLDRVIDNGSHLVLSGNTALGAFLDRVGGADEFHAAPAAFPFVDLADGCRWTVRLNDGLLPWWMLVPGRRIPGTRLKDYLAAGRLRRAPAEATIDDLFKDSPLYRRFWEPLAVSVLNTAAHEAAAAPLWPVMAETFLRGGLACRPLIARRGLSAALVDPAVAWLTARDVPLATGWRLRRMQTGGDRVTALEFDRDTVVVGPDDAVILAVGAAVAVDLVPDLVAPDAFRPIVNVHYRLDHQVAPAGAPALLGVVGGRAHWLFLRDDLVSVTVSAADDLAARSAEAVADLLWREIVRALDLPAGAVPPARVIKEKRATFAQTPAQLARRPGTATAWKNLALAGDWTATGVPATLEGALRSGNSAADFAQKILMNP